MSYDTEEKPTVLDVIFTVENTMCQTTDFSTGKTRKEARISEEHWNWVKDVINNRIKLGNTRADIAQGDVADVIFNNIYAKFLEIINSCGDPFKRSAYRDMAPLLKKAIAAAINKGV